MINDFEEKADRELSHLLEILEQNENLEVHLSDGVLTIKATNGDYAINKHLTTEQIWFSSPVSNLKYFICKDGKFVEKKSLHLTLKQAILDDLKK